MTFAAIWHGRTGQVVSARPADMVRAVVDLLAQYRIGAVPVVEGDSVVGIFSERDLVRLIAPYGTEAPDRRLDEVMNKLHGACHSTIAGLGALSLLRQKRIRHLPVVDDGRRVAFVSYGDLVTNPIEKRKVEGVRLWQGGFRVC